MDDTKNTAQTSTEANVSGAVGEKNGNGSGQSLNESSSGTAALQKQSPNAGTDNASGAVTETASEADFSDNSSTDKGSEADKSKGQAAEGEKAAPKGEKSSEYARRRREAEQAKAIKEAEEKAIIQALGGINPYTEEEMKDSHDVAEFLMMQEIKKNGGDPISDFARHQKDRERREADERKKQEDEKAWYQNDKSEFVKAYPDVSLSDLIEDKMFQSFAGGKVGTVPLKEIYEGFLSFTAEYDKRANEKAAQIAANAKASPGALSSAGKANEPYFSFEQVKAMSRSEVHRNYDKIMKSMQKWG